MPESPTNRRNTRVSRVVHAPRKVVYQAFLNGDAVATWLPPETMAGQVHTFEPHPGGRIRMSLKYQNLASSPGGKTSEDTDTFEGSFAELVTDEKIVWITTFESQDSQFAGEMTITFSLTDAGGGTEVVVLCEGIPAGVRLEDNELGSRSSLQKLAAFVE